MAVEERVIALPAVPYRGIRPFRYVDHAIFFARDEETRRLASLVAVYRGAMLYGDSGNGKSSLINAGLIPAVMDLGFEPERVRVQPRAGEEIVVEQIATAEGEPEQLISLSTEAFAERVRANPARRPLLIFDQFEEIVTLFEEQDAADEQARIVDMLVRLLHEPVPVKLLFAFREDYLGRIKQLLDARPELVDQALRLGPPAAEALPTIISGPFERFPGHFERPFDAALVERLCAALAERFGTGDLSLSEVQTVCLRLWRADDREALLAARGVQGLLEDYLSEALDAFPPDVRAAAIALLAQMVTAAGTRNVISAEDLVQRVEAAGDDTPRPRLERALERLESESRLVRRERRRDLYLYEITSEFLVPWISRRREELRRQVERRRFYVLAAVAAAVLVVAAIVAGVAIWALAQRSKANEQERVAASGALAGDAGRLMALRPDLAMLLDLQAYATTPTTAARDAAITAVQRSEDLAGLVSTDQGAIARLAVSPDGRTVAVSGSEGSYITDVDLVDVRTRRVTGPLAGHTNDVLNLAFSPDGRTFASSSEDNTVRLWDVPSGRADGDPIPAGHGTGVAFTPDGRRLVMGAEYLGLVVMDLETRRTVAEHADFDLDPDALVLSGDGETVAVGDSERSIQFFTLSGDRLTPAKRCASVPGSRAWSLALSVDQEALAWAGPGGIGLFDMRRCRVMATRELRQPAVVAFSPDGEVLAAGGTGLDLWRVPSLARIKRLTTATITGLAFVDDGTLVSSTSRGGVLTVWDLTGASSLRRLVHPPRSKWLSLVAVSPDGGTLAAAANRQVTLWDTRTDRPIGEPMRVSYPSTLAFDPRGGRLAIGTDAGGLSLWDVSTQERLGPSVRAHRQSVTTTIAFRRDGQALASTGSDGEIALWSGHDLRSLGPAIKTSEDSIYSMVFLHDGTIATCNDIGVVRVWDPETRRSVGAPMRTGCSAEHGLALSPDGRTLASGGLRTFSLWDTRTHERQGGPLPGNGSSLDFSADGETLATAGGSLQLWDVSSRRPIGDPMPGADDVQFSDDGNVLVSHTGVPADGVTVWDPLLWSRDADAFKRRICPIVGRSFTDAERDEYLHDGDYEPAC